MSRTAREILHSALCEVRDDQTARPSYAGICCAVQGALLDDKRLTTDQRRAATNLLDTLTARWPERFTRAESAREAREYPVGGRLQYLYESSDNCIWDNPRRWDLLRWLIEETKP